MLYNSKRDRRIPKGIAESEKRIMYIILSIVLYLNATVKLEVVEDLYVRISPRTSADVFKDHEIDEIAMGYILVCIWSTWRRPWKSLSITTAFNSLEG